MKQLRLLSLFAVMVLITACRGVTGPAPLEMTPTTSPDARSYPPPAPAVPATESYPAPPTLVAAPTGYPEGSAVTVTGTAPAAGSIWLLHPWGIQCEGPGPYADLDAAVAALTEAGVEVLEAENVDLMVCQACGCATPEHFRVRITAAGEDAALALGWQLE